MSKLNCSLSRPDTILGLMIANIEFNTLASAEYYVGVVL